MYQTDNQSPVKQTNVENKKQYDDWDNNYKINQQRQETQRKRQTTRQTNQQASKKRKRKTTK